MASGEPTGWVWHGPGPMPSYGHGEYVAIAITGSESTIAITESHPIAMVLYCPACGVQHIDAPSPGWDNPPHKSHLCAGCGIVWRPADVCTTGVAKIATEGKSDTWFPGDKTLPERVQVLRRIDELLGCYPEDVFEPLKPMERQTSQKVSKERAAVHLVRHVLRWLREDISKGMHTMEAFLVISVGQHL